jgi:hypothetical protein
MTEVNYQKRSNAELFQKLAAPEKLNCSQIQNYVPVYKRFFNLNETNYNSINFNHPWFLHSIQQKIDPHIELYECKIRDSESKKVKDTNVFFKMAPLVDPVRFLIGKLKFDDPLLFQLPTIYSTPENSVSQFVDSNNAAYVDSLFLFLSSSVLRKTQFIHKVEYYGSYLAVKENFKFNVFDDIDYLVQSPFFVNNKNVLFQVDNFDHIVPPDFFESGKKPPIKISSLSSRLSIESIHDDIFDNVFADQKESTFDEGLEDLTNATFELSSSADTTVASAEPTVADSTIASTSSSCSTSTCSSRTSYTDENSDLDLLESMGSSGYSSDDDVDSDSDSDSDSMLFEEVFATIPKCPVHIIAMEDCEETLDALILENDDLQFSEWTSALFQVIMILITYQKVFSFTHNDLHTNNIMWKHTNKKFLFYKFGQKIYRVPTFNRLFKIIDFGRSIFKFKDQTFCSDSYRPGGEAAGQYNIEPYYNPEKPRVEPNFSFDLCRLACSIFDYVVDDLDDVKDLSKCKPIQKLITEWCLDDKGHNMLYKHNGADRYPDFKLYKMIAKSVHNHTPQTQLERPEFSKYVYKLKKGEKMPADLIDIDAMAPQFV